MLHTAPSTSKFMRPKSFLHSFDIDIAEVARGRGVRGLLEDPGEDPGYKKGWDKDGVAAKKNRRHGIDREVCSWDRPARPRSRACEKHRISRRSTAWDREVPWYQSKGPGLYHCGTASEQRRALLTPPAGQAWSFFLFCTQVNGTLQLRFCLSPCRGAARGAAC